MSIKISFGGRTLRKGSPIGREIPLAEETQESEPSNSQQECTCELCRSACTRGQSIQESQQELCEPERLPQIHQDI